MRLERPRLGQAEAQLARALTASALASGVAMAIEEHRSHPWASATFVGTQHALTLAAAPTAALGSWIAALPDADLSLAGHLIASIAVDRIEEAGGAAALSLTVLTLEDR